MEKAEFMKKPFTLAGDSQQYITRLWENGIAVLKSGASISSFFSFILNAFTKAVMQAVAFSMEIRKLSLNRFAFLPILDSWSRRTPPLEDEYFSAETGRPNVSFMLNVNVARRIASKLAKRIAPKTSKPAPLLESELEEETSEERIDELAKNVPHIVTDLQSRFESRLAPSLKGMALAFQEYGKQSVLLPIAEPSRLEDVSLHPSMPSREWQPLKVESPERPLREQRIGLTPRAARAFGFAAGLPSIVDSGTRILESTATFSLFPHKKPSLESIPEKPTAVSQAPLIYEKEARLKQPPMFSIYHMMMTPRAARAFGFAAGFPSIAYRRETEAISPYLKLPDETIESSISAPAEALKPDVVSLFEYAARFQSVLQDPGFHILKRPADFSLFPSSKTFAPEAVSSLDYPKSTILAPMHPSQIGFLLKDIFPSLSSWVYGVSEVLRGTSLSLSAVPVAASTAEKVVTETLVQPISGFNAPQIFDTPDQSLDEIGVRSGERVVGLIEPKAFELPAIITSLIVALNQKYPILSKEPITSETYDTSIEVARGSPEEIPAAGGLPEFENFSKLPTVIALAAAGNLIAQRLHHEFNTLVKEIRFTRSSYGEKLGELGAFSPTSAPLLSRLTKAAPAMPQTLQPYEPIIASSPPPFPRLSPVSPATQNAFNITISAESAEEDLRDLERKISKILSEQIRRHYGSPRI